MAEIATVIVEGLAALLELALRWLIALVSGLVVLVCFLCSRRFRARRREAWAQQPGKKVADLITAAAWLVLVVGLPCFLLLPRAQRSKADASGGFYVVRGGTNVGLRLQLLDPGTNELRVGFSDRHKTGQVDVGYVAVKKGGLSKILDTRSVKELKTQLVENVSFHPASATNRAPNPTR